MKKGIIALVNGTNKNVARLTTGEIVLGTKEHDLKQGSIVTYVTEKQTQRYVTQEDIAAGNATSLYKENGTDKALIDIPADQQRNVNRVQGVFADEAKFIELMTQTALLDKKVDLAVEQETKSLAKKYAALLEG